MSNVWLLMHKPWMDKVEKESGGRIKFEGYPAMQLGGTPVQLYDQARDGVVDVVWTLPGNTAGRFPRIEVFELPFMMNNAESTSKAYWEYLQTQCPDEFKETQVLALQVHGPGMFHTATKPIKTPADLKGLKVRGPTRQVTKLLGSLGATPVGMPLPQIPDALSKGTIEGCVIPWEVVPSVKVHELTKFHSEFDRHRPALYTTTFVMAMNKAKYDGLAPDLKKVIDANSGMATSAWLGKVQQGNDVPSAARARWTATTPSTPSRAAEREEFIKLSSQIDDEWVADMDKRGFKGKALLDSRQGADRQARTTPWATWTGPGWAPACRPSARRWATCGPACTPSVPHGRSAWSGRWRRRWTTTWLPAPFRPGPAYLRRCR
jgi:TRAP-type C4-dicarboxylate transport system substrate-binding protein